jgi:hypothetical protein
MYFFFPCPHNCCISSTFFYPSGLVGGHCLPDIFLTVYVLDFLAISWGFRAWGVGGVGGVRGSWGWGGGRPGQHVYVLLPSVYKK